MKTWCLLCVLLVCISTAASGGRLTARLDQLRQTLVAEGSTLAAKFVHAAAGITFAAAIVCMPSCDQAIRDEILTEPAAGRGSGASHADRIYLLCHRRSGLAAYGCKRISSGGLCVAGRR